jgi:hypothetical protein
VREPTGSKGRRLEKTLKKKPGQRHGQPAISDEMKAWSTALTTETADWPQISQRSFFGFTALYRREKIFALLPRSRNLENANTIAFKLESPSAAVQKQLSNDGRIGSFQQENARWFTFLISSDADLHDALDWLGHACDAARTIRKIK